MIDFQGKLCPGLLRRIADAGVALWQENNVWVSSNDTAVAALVAAYTLAQAKEDIGGDVTENSGRLIAKALGNRAIEAVTWPILVAEVRAYRLTPLAISAPTLDAEATIRGITLAALVDIVEAKANVWLTLRAQIQGNCGKLRDQIDAAADFASLFAVNTRSGWPE